MTASFYPNPTTNDPREAVLDRLERAYEHWTEEERRLQAKGDYTQAEGAHQVTLYVVRALDAETMNPKPEPLT